MNDPKDMKWVAEAQRNMTEALKRLSPLDASFLVVDDCESDRTLLIEELRKLYGVNNMPAVVECAVPDEAIKLIADFDFDLVWLDVKLPPGDGMRVLRDTKQTKPLQKFVVITGYENAELRDKALTLGCPLLMAKPATQAKLQDVLGYIRG